MECKIEIQKDYPEFSFLIFECGYKNIVTWNGRPLPSKIGIGLSYHLSVEHIHNIDQHCCFRYPNLIGWDFKKPDPHSPVVQNYYRNQLDEIISLTKDRPSPSEGECVRFESG